MVEYACNFSTLVRRREDCQSEVSLGYKED